MAAWTWPGNLNHRRGGSVEEQLDRLIHTRQRIQGEPVSAAAFWRWRRDVLETLARFGPSREAFSQRLISPRLPTRRTQ